MQRLGQITFANGKIRHYVQIGSKGHDSPRITVIESFEGGELKTSYQARGRGMVEVVVDGPVRDAIAAGGRMGAAALLRPSKVTVGAVSTSQGVGGSGGSSESTSAGGDVDVRQSAVQESDVSTSSEQNTEVEVTVE